ncbi:hypothetical protein CN637_03935 [Bacillus toyonensis]|uniref:hypothetical protein n=1 Tax=Bacillus toyonensis TaxID=155322 RepID=UPI000BF249F8|nr:hypothetical protein [Bacillus toyonensis]PEL71159.1 hypothetical protein CN637_03935 [Bacillus toyonensis]
MDIKTITESVQAIHNAYDKGIISVRDNQVHVTRKVLEFLLQEAEVRPMIVSRVSKEYPFEVSFDNNGVTYYSLYSAQETKNKFGGFIDELITSN